MSLLLGWVGRGIVVRSRLELRPIEIRDVLRQCEIGLARVFPDLRGKKATTIMHPFPDDSDLYFLV